MSRTHTPTPWRADYSPMASFQGEITCWRVLKDRKIIADACSPEDAKRIVLCCNAHDDLVAAGNAILEARRKGELHYAEVEFGRLRAALAKAGEKMSDNQEPKQQKINRMDPAWAMFAAAFIGGPWHPDMGYSPLDQYTPSNVADFADAMLRERDRRDREEME